MVERLCRCMRLIIVDSSESPGQLVIWKAKRFQPRLRRFRGLDNTSQSPYLDQRLKETPFDSYLTRQAVDYGKEKNSPRKARPSLPRRAKRRRQIWYLCIRQIILSLFAPAILVLQLFFNPTLCISQFPLGPVFLEPCLDQTWRPEQDAFRSDWCCHTSSIGS